MTCVKDWIVAVAVAETFAVLMPNSVAKNVSTVRVDDTVTESPDCRSVVC